jgi:hypothetical protein
MTVLNLVIANVYDYRLFALAFANRLEKKEDPENWQYNTKNPTDRVWTRI